MTFSVLFRQHFGSLNDIRYYLWGLDMIILRGCPYKNITKYMYLAQFT